MDGRSGRGAGRGSGLVRAACARTKKAITAFGILQDYRAVLVRDDFGGYASLVILLAGPGRLSLEYSGNLTIGEDLLELRVGG